MHAPVRFFKLIKNLKIFNVFHLFNVFYVLCRKFSFAMVRSRRIRVHTGSNNFVIDIDRQTVWTSNNASIFELKIQKLCLAIVKYAPIYF